MYVSGVWEHLRGPVKTQNHIMAEWVSVKHSSLKVCFCNRGVMKIIYFFTHWNFFYPPFAFKLKKQRESVTKTKTVQLSLLLPHFFSLMCIFFCPFCSSLILTLKMRRSGGTQHHWVGLQPPCPACHPPSSPPCPLLDECRHDWSYWVGGSSTIVEQCSLIGSVLFSL